MYRCIGSSFKFDFCTGSDSFGRKYVGGVFNRFDMENVVPIDHEMKTNYYQTMRRVATEYILNGREVNVFPNMMDWLDDETKKRNPGGITRDWAWHYENAHLVRQVVVLCCGHMSFIKHVLTTLCLSDDHDDRPRISIELVSSHWAENYGIRSTVERFPSSCER